MLILNLVLILAVIGVVLALLSWAIVSSRTGRPAAQTDLRQPAAHPYARPHVRHPYWTDAHRRSPGVRRPVTD